jgi:protein TonB
MHLPPPGASIERLMATTELEPAPRRALAPAVALSVLLHAAVLLAVASLVIPADEAPPLIRIVLTGGGGGGSEGGGELAGPPAPAPRPAAAAPQPVVAPPPPRPEPVARRPEPKPERPPVRPRAVAPKPAPPPRQQPQPAARPEAGVDTARLPPSGGGTGGGQGAGSGSGTGPGRGSGSGGGTGSGTGSGRGSGAGAAGDLRVLCVSCPEPPYPRIARLRGWQGVVDVEVSIAPDGNVADASVARSSGYAALDDAALASARRSRFQLGGEGAVRGRIPYRFRLTAGR